MAPLEVAGDGRQGDWSGQVGARHADVDTFEIGRTADHRVGNTVRHEPDVGAARERGERRV